MRENDDNRTDDVNLRPFFPEKKVIIFPLMKIFIVSEIDGFMGGGTEQNIENEIKVVYYFLFMERTHWIQHKLEI